MRSIDLVFLLFSLLILTACQVGETTSTGGLISGHVPVTNKFTLNTPISRTYKAAEVISLTVSFPFDIIVNTVGGTPRLAITVGATAYYATYASQPTTKTLNFNYTVAATDNDTDGINVNAIELNGSTLTFNNNGVITNCDTTTFTATHVPGVKVDTIVPTVSNFTLNSLPGYYNLGEIIVFSMTFSEAVYLTGTPTFSITLDSGVVNATYVSGSGTTVLNFTYTVTATTSDTNGFNAITSPLNLGAGTLVDTAGNNANLDFSAFTAAVITSSANVYLDGQSPYVVNVAVPANGTYNTNQHLDFVIEFSEEVFVTGSPYLNVVIGSNTRQAHFLSKSVRFLTFRYTAVPGDVDSDGIAMATSPARIEQNGGNITDASALTFFTATTPSNNLFAVPSMSGVRVEALQPQPIGVARNADNTNSMSTGSADNVWNIGQVLYLTVTFNTGMYVTQTGGTPYIPITIGSTVRSAPYLSGGNGQTSLIFSYTIQEGDHDTDGSLTLGNITLNGGVITDVHNTNSLLTLPITSLTSTNVDGVRPIISSITPPGNGTYSQIAPLTATEMSFAVNWSEPVNFSATTAGSAYLSLDIGGTILNANYVSGNNSATTNHRPASLAGTNDVNGIAVNSPFAGTATIRDLAGNNISVLTITPPTTTGILVDTTAPAVTGISAVNTNGTYKAGENLDFTVTFSESVTTTVSGGYPRIPITIGATTLYLIPTANSTSTIHTFRYTIQSGELDTDGVVVGTAVQNSGTGYVRDAGRNNVTGTFTSPNTSLLNVDAVVPTITSTGNSAARAYVSGETLSITVSYSEIVNVNTGGGTPFIAVDFDLGTDNFTYVSGTGTTTLTFSRTLDANHFDMNGLPTSISSIMLNGGVIEDAGRNAAPTAFTAIDLSAHYVTYPEVRLWVRSDFVNMAPPGGVTVSSTGVVTTEACGTGTCRTFDGDDSLTLTSSLNSVSSVLMAFKTPATVPGLTTYDIFDIGIGVTEDFVASAFDLTTLNANILVNGTPYTGINHNLNLAVSSTHVLQVNFSAAQAFSTLLIESAYRGAIGEVIAIDGNLTATQLTNIRNYLDVKF